VPALRTIVKLNRARTGENWAGPDTTILNHPASCSIEASLFRGHQAALATDGTIYLVSRDLYALQMSRKKCLQGRSIRLRNRLGERGGS
jgi:hypothetical protein